MPVIFTEYVAVTFCYMHNGILLLAVTATSTIRGCNFWNELLIEVVIRHYKKIVKLYKVQC